MDVSQVRADLIAEQQALDDIVVDLADEQWRLATPSPRWTVADQIGHLTYFDHNAALAVTDPDEFEQGVAALLTNLEAADDAAADDFTLAAYRAMDPGELLDAWREGRRVLADVAATLDDDTRIGWYGPPMGSKSFLTARMMECWAHGQDVCDTVGASRPATDRLRHIAQLGFITRGWSYVNRGIEPPDATVRVVLDAPSGATWELGPEDADEAVAGPAEDFCLVVTQRRHFDDTALTVDGAAARDWLVRAQVFAGPPSDGPAPR